MKKKALKFDWQNSLVFDVAIEIIILAVIFLMPTIFDRRLGIVFSGTKVAFLRLFGVIILSLWSLRLLITRQHRFFRTPLDWPILSFLFCATIATLSSVHVYTSLVGFYGRYEGLTTWYLFGLLFFVITNYIKTEKQIKRIIVAVAMASILSAMYSMLQRFSLDPYMWGGVITWQRVIGMIGQPNFLAAYMLMSFFLVLSLLLLDKRETDSSFNLADQFLPLGSFFFVPVLFLMMIYNLEAYNIFLWYAGFTLLSIASIVFAYTYEKLHPQIFNVLLIICLFLDYICVLYTQSRGGYMGLMTGAVLFSLVAGRKVIFANWRKLLMVFVLIVFISGVTMLQPEFSPFERFTSEVTTKADLTDAEKADSKLELKGAAGSRGETWKSALGIIADNPLFGVGPEVLKMVFPRYETDLFRFKEAFHVKQDRCHNETFDVSVTKGILAFFVYLWVLFVFFQTGWCRALQGSPATRLLLAGALAAGLSYLIQNQFSFGVIAITSLFWVILGLVMMTGEPEAEDKPIRINWLELPWFNVAAIILVALILSYVSFYSFRGDIWFKSGKTKMEMGQFKEAINDFDTSLGVFPFEGTTISHLGIAYLNLANLDSANRGQNMTLAIQTLQRGTRVDAYNADNFYLLAKVYFMMGDMSQAKACGQKAIKIDPYYAEVYHLLGLIEWRQGQTTLSQQYFEKAFFINPNLAEPMADLMRLNGQLGQPAATLKVFERALKKYPDNLLLAEQVARQYLAIGRVKETEVIANRLIRLSAINPAEAKSGLGYVIRAAAYARQGEGDKAFADLQQAIMIDPKNVAAHLELGRFYLARGEKLRAKEEFEQVLQLEPSNSIARDFLSR